MTTFSALENLRHDRRTAIAATVVSARARRKPSANKAATTGCRSDTVTAKPNEASTNASRPRPPVPSHTRGWLLWFTALPNNSPPP